MNNKGKHSVNPFNIVKNQEFELIIYIASLQNLISPKLAWNNQWSLNPLS